MKRTIITLIILSMIISNISLVFADTSDNNGKIDLKKAIEIAKTSFDLETENYDFSQNYYETQGDTKQWSLQWISEKTGENINITVDGDTGDIIHMNRWESSYQESHKLAKYPREGALKVANELLYRLQPKKYKDMELVEEEILKYYYDYENYNFQYRRMVNGIPFGDNGVIIRIDKNTLEVRNYNFNWYKGTLPVAKKAISLEKGKEAFNKNSKLELSYFIKYDNKTKSDKAIFVYSLENGNIGIDALTGEPLKNYYGITEMGGLGGGGNAKMYEEASSLTPQEVKSTEEIAKYISKEKALEISEDLIKHNKKLELTYAALYSYDNGKADWSFTWDYNNPKEKEYYNVYLTIDAVNGEIKNYNRYDSNLEKLSKGTPKYNKDQSKKLAEEFLAKTIPGKYKETEYKIDNEDQKNIENPINYQFTFNRKINDIPCKQNNLTVVVNCYTGDITSFYSNWSDIEFPKAVNLMPLDKAYEKLYENGDFELKYIIYYDYEKPYPNNTSAKLIYSFKSFSGMIDPKTGELLDYNGEEIKEDLDTNFKDIENHWAKDDILALVEAGIISDSKENFFPDSEIKQKDFIQMLISATAPNYYPIIPLKGEEVPDEEYDRYYKEAIAKNIIEEKDKNLNKEVSRIEGAKMLVNSKNLATLASKGEIFNIFYKDKDTINEDLRGYVAIITGLDIMTGNNGYFYPSKSLTRAETASIIVRLLQN